MADLSTPPPQPPYAQTPKAARMQAKLAKAHAKALRPWYKKKRWWFTGLAVVILIIIIASVASIGNSINKLNNTPESVSYSVTGTGKAIVSYDVQHGDSLNLAQTTSATLPWTKTITMTGAFGDYVLNAQSTGTGTTISCKITVNGKQVASNTSHGKDATVSCSGT